MTAVFLPTVLQLRLLRPNSVSICGGQRRCVNGRLNSGNRGVECCNSCLLHLSMTFR